MQRLLLLAIHAIALGLPPGASGLVIDDFETGTPLSLGPAFGISEAAATSAIGGVRLASALGNGGTLGLDFSAGDDSLLINVGPSSDALRLFYDGVNDGNSVLNSGNLNVDLTGLNAFTIDVASLTGSLNVLVQVDTTGVGVTGGLFPISSSGTLTIPFSALNLVQAANFADIDRFSFSFNAIPGVAGTISIRSIAAVPEPSTALLVAAGLAGVARMSRRASRASRRHDRAA